MKNTIKTIHSFIVFIQYVPLKAWLYRGGFARFSNMRYTMESINDTCILYQTHICMEYLNIHKSVADVHLSNVITFILRPRIYSITVDCKLWLKFPSWSMKIIIIRIVIVILSLFRVNFFNLHQMSI